MLPGHAHGFWPRNRLQSLRPLRVWHLATRHDTGSGSDGWNDHRHRKLQPDQPRPARVGGRRGQPHVPVVLLFPGRPLARRQCRSPSDHRGTRQPWIDCEAPATVVRVFFGVDPAHKQSVLGPPNDHRPPVGRRDRILRRIGWHGQGLQRIGQRLALEAMAQGRGTG